MEEVVAGFTLTEEQEAILQQDRISPINKIEGRAGAAKTTSLELLARQRGGRGFYVCFNRAGSEDARKRFPPYVTSKTIHSVAYGAMNIGRASAKLSRRIFPEELGKMYPISPSLGLRSDMFGGLVLATVVTFCNSGDDVLDESHVLLSGVWEPYMNPEIVRIAVGVARKVFARMASFNDDFPMLHDVYLKLWQQSGSPMPAGIEWILFDEAQDANGVQIAAMLNQSVPVTWVGDPHQQIYRFRGAVNAMRTIPSGRDLALTQSFRFGQSVADIANGILLSKPEETRPEVLLRGDPRRATEIGRIRRQSKYTFLARTNGECFREAQNVSGSVHVVGGHEGLMRMLRSAHALWSGHQRRDMAPEIARFQDWSSLCEAAEMPGGSELSTVKGIVEEYRGRLPGCLRMFEDRHVSSEDEADVIVSTFHRSKGREWDYVRLGGMSMRHPGHEKWSGMSDEEKEDETNLAYVAATRARVCMEIPQGVLDFLAVGRENGWTPATFDESKAQNNIATSSRPVDVAGSGKSSDSGGVASSPYVVRGVKASTRGSFASGLPNSEDNPREGDWTNWQRDFVAAAVKRGVGIVQIARVVHRPPDVVRLEIMRQKGCSSQELKGEGMKILQRFGGKSAMARQVEYVLGGD